MSIYEYFMFCLEEDQWSAPALIAVLPKQLIVDEL
jgi:hypothetical protein